MVLESVDGEATLEEIGEKLGIEFDLVQKIAFRLFVYNLIEVPGLEKRYQRPRRKHKLETGLAEARRTNKGVGMTGRTDARPAKLQSAPAKADGQAVIRRRWERERADRALEKLVAQSNGAKTPEPKPNVHVEPAPDVEPNERPDSDVWSGLAAVKKRFANVRKLEKSSPANPPAEAEDELPAE